ncbi:uncharacterized protein LOC132716571 [Ruditapes philippinarum]|uniref:uncharacterized protein LOC132716571 n=1 Tax=Ruditapes philippinarum TaxID=129788 RepID=UPI00295B4ECC|nr:uncharacterized protein LOC132716571 [Ruditapes philippinarum]
MSKFWIVVLFCIAACVRTCNGSAWLQDPPSRSAAWYYQIKTPVNYNFRNLDCGAVPVKINADGSRNCGLCGDPYTDKPPRDNEVGGKYANPRVRTRFYESGQVAEISIWNNLPGAPGFYEFRLCDEDSNQTQACLDKHLLTITDTGKTYMEVPPTQGLIIIHVQLPAGVTCNYCLLQWRFRKETYAGCDDQKWCRVQGAQTEYYNCADVMIGNVGQPKPSYISDPIYSASDYGSAYDVATTRTDQPDGSNLNGTTTEVMTTTTTKGVPVITIPTGFPVTTTTSGPGTTNRPVTVITTGTTQVRPTSTPESPRLVIGSSGNSIGGQTISNGNGGSSNNKYVFALLSLIPLLGAVSLHNSRALGPVQPPPVPPIASVTWARALPIYPLQIENNYGFGNFAAGSPAFSTTGTYGGKNGKGTYGSKSSYHAGYSIYNAGLSATNLNSQGTNTGISNQLLASQQNRNMLTNNNINTQWNQASNFNKNSFNNNNGFLNNGRGQFAQNPVVWNNGVTVNNGITRHVFPRSVNFQSGTSYQPTPNQYSKPIGTIQKNSHLSQNEYGTSHQSGYGQSNSIAHPNTRLQVPTNVNWQGHQRIHNVQNTRVGQGTRNWANNAVNTANNNWQNSGDFNSGNNANINGAGTGQRLPVPETVTSRMRIMNPKVTPPSDNTFNLPGIESASRFQVNSPRNILETSQPIKNLVGSRSTSNGAVLQNGGGKLNAIFTEAQNNNNSGAGKGRPRFLVNEWYNMLLKRLQSEGSRSL